MAALFGPLLGHVITGVIGGGAPAPAPPAPAPAPAPAQPVVINNTISQGSTPQPSSNTAPTIQASQDEQGTDGASRKISKPRIGTVKPQSEDQHQPNSQDPGDYGQEQQPDGGSDDFRGSNTPSRRPVQGQSSNDRYQGRGNAELDQRPLMNAQSKDPRIEQESQPRQNRPIAPQATQGSMRQQPSTPQSQPPKQQYSPAQGAVIGTGAQHDASQAFGSGKPQVRGIGAPAGKGGLGKK